MDDDLVRRITEMHVFKGDLSLDRRIALGIEDLDRMRTFRHFFLFAQKLKDTLSGRCGRLQDIHVLRDHGDRLIEAAHIRDERLNVTDRDRSLHRQIAAQDRHADITEIADEGGDRLHQTAQEL